MMTYIVPITAISQSIHHRIGDHSFSVPNTPEMLDERPGVRKVLNGDDKLQRANDPLPYTSLERMQLVYSSFLSKLKSCTMHNAIGGTWINTRPLLAWILEKVDQQVTRLEHLLDYAYSASMVPSIKASDLSRSGEASLIVFSLLLELRHGHLIHRFWRHGLNDSRLPFDKGSLDSVLMEHVSLVSQILLAQWKYCPIIFDLDMALELPAKAVLPIIQRQRINDKGTTAQLWEISIPEEYVGRSLRRAASFSAFSSASDNLGRVSPN
jgi:hypothetical protein